jgi:hypothetical protein
MGREWPSRQLLRLIRGAQPGLGHGLGQEIMGPLPPSVIPLAASPIACAHLLIVLPPVLSAKGGPLLEEQGRWVRANAGKQSRPIEFKGGPVGLLVLTGVKIETRTGCGSRGRTLLYKWNLFLLLLDGE